METSEQAVLFAVYLVGVDMVRVRQLCEDGIDIEIVHGKDPCLDLKLIPHENTVVVSKITKRNYQQSRMRRQLHERTVRPLVGVN